MALVCTRGVHVVVELQLGRDRVRHLLREAVAQNVAGELGAEEPRPVDDGAEAEPSFTDAAVLDAQRARRNRQAVVATPLGQLLEGEPPRRLA